MLPESDIQEQRAQAPSKERGTSGGGIRKSTTPFEPAEIPWAVTPPVDEFKADEASLFKEKKRAKLTPAAKSPKGTTARR
jgi:hypothetical protein